MRHLLVMVALAGCGEDWSDYPSCDPGELAITGTLSSGTHERSGFTTSHAFVNAGEPATFEASLGASDTVSMEWPTSVANGDSAPLKATIDFGLLQVGNCESGGYPGQIHMMEEGGGFRFVLRDLRAPIFCSNAPQTGELYGCFRFPLR